MERINDSGYSYDFFGLYEDIYGYDSLDIMTREEIGNDYSYHTLVKSVRDAERFNYHSDYWGDAETYQERAVEFVENIEPYIGETIKFDNGDGYTEATLVGVLIDRQYNSHLKLLIETPVDVE